MDLLSSQRHFFLLRLFFRSHGSLSQFGLYWHLGRRPLRLFFGVLCFGRGGIADGGGVSKWAIAFANNGFGCLHRVCRDEPLPKTFLRARLAKRRNVMGISHCLAAA